MTIRVHEIDDARSWPSVAAEWEDLRRRSAGAGLFLSHAWIAAWLRHFGEGCSPRILVARDGSRWVGAVPLVSASARKGGVRFRTLRFTANLESGNVRGGFLLAEREREVVSALVEHLRRASDSWECWDLSGLPADSPAVPHLYDLLTTTFRTTTWSPRQLLQYLTVAGTWDEYLRSRGDFKKKMRNHLNRLNRFGSPAFVRYDSPDRIQEGWDVVARLEARSSKALKPGCVRLEGAVLAFHREIANDFAATGNYQIDALTVNGQAAACLVSLREGKTLCLHYTCTDDALLHLAVARILFVRVFEDAWAGGFRSIDFNGETRFVRTWTKECRIALECRVYNRAARSRLAWLREQVAGPAVRRARSGVRRWIPLTPLPAGKQAAGAGPRELPDALRRSSCAFYENGRSALDRGLESLPLEPGDEILFPSYHCGSELEVLLRKGYSLRFYDVPLGLDVAPAALEAALTGRTRAAYVIHYLGFPQDTPALSEFCRRKGLLLVEDCAHALYGADPDRPIGRFGDLSIFSLHKWLPMRDGGAAVRAPDIADRMPAGARRQWRDAVAHRLESAIARRRYGASWGSAAVEVACRVASFAAGRLGLVPKVRRSREMTGESLDILRRTDHRGAAAARRANYLALLDAFSGVPGLAPRFPSLGEGAVPLFFPLIVENPAPFVDAMARAGVEAAVLWKFVHPAVPQDRFHDAAYLRCRLVVLPVHQDLTQDDIATITAAAAPFPGAAPAAEDTGS